MQRIVSINLNGNAYQLEENGYNALFAYLDAIDAHLKDSPDRAQTLADLERSVAEKCQACLNPHKTVVTSGEIDGIIFDLGPLPGQPAAETRSASSSASSTSSTSPSGASTSNSATSGAATSGAETSGATDAAGGERPRTGPTHRRLYQIREGSMISGVCAGLSEFLHLDVTLIRIMFVIFAFVTSGWGILVYGVLMFVVPKVHTRADASGDTAATGTVPPHHWPWDEGWPWDKHGWPWDKHGWPWDHDDAHDWRGATQDAARAAREAGREARKAGLEVGRQARAEWREKRREWREQRRAARMAHHHWGPWGTIGTIIFIGFAFFWLSVLTRGGGVFGWPFFWGFPFWGFPHWMGIVFFFMVMRFVFMPFRGPGRYGYGPYGPHDPDDHPHHAWLSMWHGMSWFLMAIFLVWAAFHFIPGMNDFMRSFQTSWNQNGFHV